MTEIFNLLVAFLIKQKFRSSHSKVFLKVGVPRGKLKRRKNPRKKNLQELIFGKVVGCRSTYFRNANSLTDILKGFYEKL